MLMSSGFVNFPNALPDSFVRCPRIYSWSCSIPLVCVSQNFGSLLSIASGPISAASGPATCFPEGGRPCGADAAAAFFTTAGVVAATFAAVLLNVGYADAAAVAFAGGGVEGFAGGAAARGGDVGFAGGAFADFGGG